jgi:hypothetical protein
MIRIKHLVALVVMAFLPVAFFGCETDGEGTTFTKPVEGIREVYSGYIWNLQRQGEIVASHLITPVLPSILMTGDCQGLTPPDICTWAGSADDIVWGTIDEVRIVRYPTIIPDRSMTELQYECEGPVNPALQIDVDVVESLSGSIQGEITVHIGSRQVRTFFPVATFGPLGTLVWDVPRGTVERPLVVGQPLGMAIHYVEEYQVWSLMGELLFSQSTDAEGGQLYFQEKIGECYDPPPASNSATGQELLDLAKECAGDLADEAQQRRTRLEAMYGESPSGYMASVCLFDQDPNDNDCAIDADCQPDEKCESGSCAPR